MEKTEKVDYDLQLEWYLNHFRQIYYLGQGLSEEQIHNILKQHEECFNTARRGCCYFRSFIRNISQFSKTSLKKWNFSQESCIYAKYLIANNPEYFQFD